jgi:hypothetical protein
MTTDSLEKYSIVELEAMKRHMLERLRRIDEILERRTSLTQNGDTTSPAVPSYQRLKW